MLNFQSDVETELTILIVEDQNSLALMLKGILQSRLNCKVHIANSLQQAHACIEACGQAKPHIAICDLQLPDASDETIIEAMQAASIPVIALTGQFSETLRDTLIKRGVVDYVLKNSFNAFEYVVALVSRVTRNRFVKALIVDDSAATRHILKHYLTQQNIQSIMACDGVEGLAILEENPDVRLILTDQEMPQMNGVQFTSEVRKKHTKEEIAIIGLSGSGEGKLSARFLKHGANDFIIKPFSYEELLCRVTQNLDMLDLIQFNKRAAVRDFLTGIYNRRYFFEKGEQLFKAAARQKKPVFAAIIDIDFFKQINDKHGHDCGDIAIKQTANNLVDHFPTDLVARLGGEEFGVFFHARTREAVQESLEKFRQSQEAHQLRYNGSDPIPVRVSIGCSQLEDQASLDALLNAADENLYSAKHNGRNQVVFRERVLVGQ